MAMDTPRDRHPRGWDATFAALMGLCCGLGIVREPWAWLVSGLAIVFMIVLGLWMWHRFDRGHATQGQGLWITLGIVLLIIVQVLAWTLDPAWTPWSELIVAAVTGVCCYGVLRHFIGREHGAR